MPFGIDVDTNPDGEEDELTERGGFSPEESLNSINKRVIDEEAGVVIYAGTNPAESGYGLAAVPIKDTNLNIENKANESEGEEN